MVDNIFFTSLMALLYIAMQIDISSYKNTQEHISRMRRKSAKPEMYPICTNKNQYSAGKAPNFYSNSAFSQVFSSMYFERFVYRVCHVTSINDNLMVNTAMLLLKTFYLSNAKSR